MISTSGARVSDRRLPLVAAVCAGVAMLCAVAAIVVHELAQSRADVPGFEWASVVIASTWPLAGVVVVRSSPRNVCGWLLVASGLIGVYQLLGEYSIWNHYVADLPGSAFSDWTSMFGFAVYLFVMPLVPLLFPDGRPPSPQWRYFVMSIVTAASILTVARMFVPGETDVDPAITNPVGVPGAEWLNYVVLAMAVYCNAIGLPGAVIGLLLRMRRSAGVQRAQLQWLVLGGLSLVVGLTVSALAPGDPVFALALLGPPLGIAIAVLRHRLFDVDLALSRTLVFLAVVAVVGGGGMWLLLRLDAEVAGTRRGALLVAVLAISVVGVRAVLQRWIDRWWFPHRQGATLLGRRFAEAVSLASEPREALAELVSAVRSALRLPYVGFVGEVSTADGVRPERVVTIDAVAMGRQVGLLEVTPRREGEGFTREERRVLDEVASQAAMMAYSAMLVADVESSRARIVRATEEERRRLRNDLHDGVGPSLAGIALQIDALASRLDRDGAQGASEQARDIRDRVRTTVADVRAVSHGLRPPILDQIGLGEALRQLVSGLGVIEGQAQVDDLGGLSAAAEVATYAIASEAVANAVRHSAASRIRLDVERDVHDLTLQVIDNGRGMPSRVQPGVGLLSMRQRAAEVGGRLEHHGAQGGGTAVTLRLPLEARSVTGEAPRI